MADYTDITDPELLPDEPLTSLLAFRLRDNPLAMFEGSPDAPRLQLAALPRLDPGPDRKLGIAGPALMRVTSFETILEMSAMQAGVLRVFVDHAREGGGGTVTVFVRVSRIRAGVETVVAETSTQSSDLSLWTVDVPLVPGDTIIVDGRSQTETAGQGLVVNDCYFGTSGDDLYLGVATPYQYEGFWS